MLTAWYKELPPVTRCYLTASVAVTALCYFEIVTLFQLYADLPFPQYNIVTLWSGTVHQRSAVLVLPPQQLHHPVPHPLLHAPGRAQGANSRAAEEAEERCGGQRVVPAAERAGEADIRCGAKDSGKDWLPSLVRPSGSEDEPA